MRSRGPRGIKRPVTSPPAPVADSKVGTFTLTIMQTDLAALGPGVKSHQWALGTPPVGAMELGVIWYPPNGTKLSDGIGTALTASIGIAAGPTVIAAARQVDAGGGSAGAAWTPGSFGGIGTANLGGQSLVVELASANDLNTFTSGSGAGITVVLFYVTP